MKKIRVAILCGGLSNEREVSLRSGLQVAKNLPASKYESLLIEIASNGQWLLRGAPDSFKPKISKLSRSLEVYPNGAASLKSFSKVSDVVFIALHGKFGEDGKIQSVLELLNVPYTGSGVLASALGMNKAKAQDYLRRWKILSPKSFELRKSSPELRSLDAHIRKYIGYPCVVKPNESGSSIGVSIVDSKLQLSRAIESAFKEDESVLVSEYISGREVTCGVLGNANQTSLLALPPVEIIPKTRFFDYSAKYQSESTREICPAPIGKMLTKKIQTHAKTVHEALGCDGLTRSDFIITPRKKIYFLEINTIPGLTEQSLCPKEAQAAGMSFSDFLDAQIKLALMKAGKR